MIFQLLQADWAKCSDATASLLISAVDSVHQTLVVDAMLQAEHVTELMSYDVAASHE